MQFKEFIENIVATVGIITAHNPGGEKQSTSKNYDCNRSLLQELHDIGYKTNSFKGKYANKTEETFLVCNISKKELLEFAQKYGQKAVIYGELVDDYYYKFQYLEKGEITDEDVVEFYWTDVIDTDHFFKAVEEGTFTMPIFHH